MSSLLVVLRNIAVVALLTFAALPASAATSTPECYGIGDPAGDFCIICQDGYFCYGCQAIGCYIDGEYYEDGGCWRNCWPA